MIWPGLLHLRVERFRNTSECVTQGRIAPGGSDLSPCAGHPTGRSRVKESRVGRPRVLGWALLVALGVGLAAASAASSASNPGSLVRASAGKARGTAAGITTHARATGLKRHALLRPPVKRGDVVLYDQYDNAGAQRRPRRTSRRTSTRSTTSLATTSWSPTGRRGRSTRSTSRASTSTALAR